MASLICQWQGAFFKNTKTTYCLKPADWQAAKFLLRHYGEVSNVMEEAGRAWQQLNGFLLEKSKTLPGFYSKVNEIKLALQNGHNKTNQRINGRRFEQPRTIPNHDEGF